MTAEIEAGPTGPSVNSGGAQIHFIHKNLLCVPNLAGRAQWLILLVSIGLGNNYETLNIFWTKLNAYMRPIVKNYNCSKWYLCVFHNLPYFLKIPWTCIHLLGLFQKKSIVINELSV